MIELCQLTLDRFTYWIMCGLGKNRQTASFPLVHSSGITRARSVVLRGDAGKLPCNPLGGSVLDPGPGSGHILFCLSICGTPDRKVKNKLVNRADTVLKTGMKAAVDCVDMLRSCTKQEA